MPDSELAVNSEHFIENSCLSDFDHSDYIDNKSLNQIEKGIITKEVANILRRLLLSVDSRPATVKLVGALSGLYSRLCLLSPLKFFIVNTSQLKIHQYCWFYCNVLNAKFTLLDGNVDCSRSNENYLSIFYNATAMLKKCSSIGCRTQFCWVGETYWLLYYFFEITRIPYYNSLFCKCRGPKYVTKILNHSLDSFGYDVDLYDDFMILIMILKNAVDYSAVETFDKKIVPIFLTYLKKMHPFIYLYSSRFQYQRNVLLTMVSVIFNLFINVDKGCKQFVKYGGFRILNDFIGCHPEVDNIIYKYLNLFNKFKEIQTREIVLKKLVKKNQQIN